MRLLIEKNARVAAAAKILDLARNPRNDDPNAMRAAGISMGAFKSSGGLLDIGRLKQSKNLHLSPPRPSLLLPSKTTSSSTSSSSALHQPPNTDQFFSFLLISSLHFFLYMTQLEQNQLTSVPQRDKWCPPSFMEQEMLKLSKRIWHSDLNADDRTQKPEYSPGIEYGKMLMIFGGYCLEFTINRGIRGIQLVFKRGYNIRISGYARLRFEVEIRSVRRIVPSSGWIDKISAVQVAEV
ncbi:Transcription initiation factor TFIID subunit 12 [Ciborinia camelliae]|nr:Transcription initiation factor TFIID subunit 12 [Ciborinia camelliae]